MRHSLYEVRTRQRRRKSLPPKSIKYILRLFFVWACLPIWVATHVTDLSSVKFQDAIQCNFAPEGMKSWTKTWLISIHNKTKTVWEKNLTEGWEGYEAASDAYAIYWGDTNFGTYEFDRKTHSIHSNPGKLSNSYYQGQCTIITESQYRKIFTS